MLKRLLVGLHICIPALLVACASVAPVTLTAAPPENAINNLDFHLTESGHYRVDVMLNGQGPFEMVLDTGASISVLFEKTVNELGIVSPEGETAIVHGLIASSPRPVARVNTISFGQITQENLRVAVLADRQSDRAPAGILGMDVLGDYTLLFNEQSKTLSFFSPQTLDTDQYSGWRMIPLETNPYSDEDFGLYFLTLRVGGNTVPAVFDLGASFSLMNWEAADAPAVRRYRRRARENWELEGAIGVFDPSVLVSYDSITANSYRWKNWVVLVTELDTLDIIGSADQPLMIAGADLFRDTSFIADFQRQFILLKPSREHDRPADDDSPMTGTRLKGDTGALDVYDK